MINIFEKQFDDLAKKIKFHWKNLVSRLRIYIKKLLFPLYLFPIKILTYSVYYLLAFIIKTTLTLLKMIFEMIIYPFKGLRNLIKSVFVLIVVVYVLATLFVTADYLRNQYGHYGKFLCSFGVNDRLRRSVVRIVGGYSEGSGFFIADNQVMTNFHVVEDEPSPKVIFPDGTFVTPYKIIGNRELDIALLFLEDKKPKMVLEFLEVPQLYDQEPLISAGYPLGTDLSGEVTILKGDFLSFRESKYYSTEYIQADIYLVGGMSGGPLVDQCGYVVGMNTMSLSGMSMFISESAIQRAMSFLTDHQITKIEVDPSLSPEDAVNAFYTYLKARRMEDGFNLLSDEYLKKTNFEEWTSRFTDILDVDVILSEPYENTKDTAFVKFSTKNWVDGEAEIHYYEGTWKTIEEDGVYKMLKSNIKEVDNPGWDWFYE